MLPDVVITILIALYCALVIGSVGTLCYIWYKRRKNNKKQPPILKIVKGRNDD